MKKIINLSLSLMATALVLASCSKSNDADIENQDKGTPSEMIVKFDNPATRAVGTATGESDIVNGTVMVFRSSTGVLDGMATFTSTANPIRVKITAGTRDVYVVANTGINFTSIQNVSDLKNFASKPALSSISATGTSLPMSGSVLNQNASSATLATPATATVQLTYMCAKVSIAWNLSSLNVNMTNFTVTGAYIMNVPTLTDCFAFGNDNLTSYCTSFATGLVNPSTFNTGQYYPASPTYTNTYNASLALTSPATNSGNNYFYIFENKLATAPTIVVIEATVDGTSGATTYYYPIVINGAQNTSSGDGSATVLHGKHYTVTATIKGFGNDNPYNPIVAANMDVTITLPTWSPVVINETFE